MGAGELAVRTAVSCSLAFPNHPWWSTRMGVSLGTSVSPGSGAMARDTPNRLFFALEASVPRTGTGQVCTLRAG